MRGKPQGEIVFYVRESMQKMIKNPFAHFFMFFGGMLFVSIFFVIAVSAQNTQFTSKGNIPILPGARILKQSGHGESARIEFETQKAPDAVAGFYREAMKQRG